MSILDKFLKSILAFDPSDIPEVEDDNTDEIDETEEEVDDMKEVRELKKNITLAFKDVINYTQDLKNKKIESIDFIDVIIRKLDNIKDTINKLGVATESSENVKNILNDIDQVITFIKSGAINTNVEILNQLEAPLLELFEVWLYISQNTKDATNINFESYADDILNNLMKSDVNAADIIDQIKNYINDLKSKSNIDFTSVDLSLLENNAKKLVNNFKQKYQDYYRSFEKESVSDFYNEVIIRISKVNNAYLEYVGSLTNYTESENISKDIEDEINYQKSFDFKVFKNYLYRLVKNTQREQSRNLPTSTYATDLDGSLFLKDKEQLRTLGSIFLGKSLNSKDFAAFEKLILKIFSEINADTNIEATQKMIDNALTFNTVSSSMDNLQDFFISNKDKLNSLTNLLAAKTAKSAVVTRETLNEDIISVINRINNTIIKLITPIVALERNLTDVNSLDIAKLVPQDKVSELEKYSNYKEVYKEAIVSAKTFLDKIISFTEAVMYKFPEIQKPNTEGDTEEQRKENIKSYSVDNINTPELNSYLVECSNFITKDLHNLNTKVNELQKPLVEAEKIINNLL
jgi:hypothetical protein